MKILVKQTDESVIFTMPEGNEVEISMVCLLDEDVWIENDVNEAFRILSEDLNYFGAKELHWRLTTPRHSSTSRATCLLITSNDFGKRVEELPACDKPLIHSETVVC